MRMFIAEKLDVSVENVHAVVLGGHGDTMVPLPRFSTVAGLPLDQWLSKEDIDAIATRTANGGAEITKLVGTSRVVRAGSRGRRDGRVHPQGQEEDRALLGLPPGRVRPERRVRGRAR